MCLKKLLYKVWLVRRHSHCARAFCMWFLRIISMVGVKLPRKLLSDTFFLKPRKIMMRTHGANCAE